MLLDQLYALVLGLFNYLLHIMSDFDILMPPLQADTQPPYLSLVKFFKYNYVGFGTESQ